MTSDISKALLATASSKPALCDSFTGTKLSYEELRALVERNAAQLQSAGLQPGDAVVLAAPNSIALFSVILAIAKCGAVAVPINPASSPGEVEYFLSDCEAALLCATGEVLKNLGETSFCTAVLPDDGRLNLTKIACKSRSALFEGDACLMIYTSGTTSRPKGVPLSHANLEASVKAFSKTFSLTDRDSTLVPMPFFHVHGLIGATMSTLYTGGTAVLQPRFSASKFWQQVREHNITWYSSSPTIHRILLSRADQDDIPVGQLRFIRSSSASLGATTIGEMESTFGSFVAEAYGMTEAANQISCNPLPPGKPKPGSVGIPAGVDFRIVPAGASPHDPEPLRGEILIKGPAVMHGYHNRDEVNMESFVDGWFRTGDEGYIDSEGHLYIVGRIKELINRGGEKISPAEVEEILLQHPSVRETACFGVFDTKYGEEVEAVVVLHDTVDPREIIEFCSKHLSAIKVPKTLHIVDSIPRNATNKVQRQQLIAKYSKAQR